LSYVNWSCGCFFLVCAGHWIDASSSMWAAGLRSSKMLNWFWHANCSSGIVWEVSMLFLGVLGLCGFLPVTIFHGLSDLRAFHSLNRAVLYFSSQTGHLLASAGWSFSVMWVAMEQLTQCRLCVHCFLSMAMPLLTSSAMHFWQSGLLVCSSSLCSPAQSLHLVTS